MKSLGVSFKPYYNWNTFNTLALILERLNCSLSFKPYYNWNTFNTMSVIISLKLQSKLVLNLIITGIPSILPILIIPLICSF